MAPLEMVTNGGETARRAYQLHPSDQVAMALADLVPGEVLDLPSGRVTVTTPVAFGHKVAIVAVAAGEEILKYGEVFGRATAAITPGEHVHVHNVESQRGRGDLHRAAAP